MYYLIFLGCVSFGLSLVLTPVVRNLFRYWNLMDYPDNARKHHKRAVPRVGGIAICVSFISASVLLTILPWQGSTPIQRTFPFFLGLLPAALLVFWIGLIDDLVGLKPWHKLSGQIVAATGAYLAGIHVQAFGGHFFAAWWTFPLTLCWLVLSTNAINLIDGVDGLAAGVGLFATATMLVAALVQNNLSLAVATIPLAGCLLGFLRYNFNPATIFLGDSGSLFIGFLLGCYGVLWSEKSATILGMTAPMIALAVPLLDTGLSVVRRFMTRKPIFAADRGHIHHRLLDLGLKPRRVVLTFYGLCSIAAIFSLIMSSQRFERLALLVFCVIAWIGIARLGYVEFHVARRMFMEGAFRRQLSSRILLQHYESTLNTASTPQECWNVIENASREFGFQRVILSLAGEGYEYRAESNMEDCWEMHVPLSDADYIDLSGPFDEMRHMGSLAPFADMLRRRIPLIASTFPKVDRKHRYRIVSRSS